MAEWSIAAVCKTAIRRFESGPRVQTERLLPNLPDGYFWEFWEDKYWIRRGGPNEHANAAKIRRRIAIGGTES